MFSFYTYTSDNGRKKNHSRALTRPASFFTQLDDTPDNNDSLNLSVPRELRRLQELTRPQEQQDPMHFYSLPTQTLPAQNILATPQEIAQQNAAASTGLLSKIRLGVAAMVVGSELKMPLAETARHGRFPELAQKDIQQFAREFQDEVNGLLAKFQENNRKQQHITGESFIVRTECNKQTIRDLNDLIANLPAIQPKFLSHATMQSALKRSIQDIETSLQRQLEINRTTVERTMLESADIAKILADLQIVKQRLCVPQQATDLAALLAQADAALSTMRFRP